MASQSDQEDSTRSEKMAAGAGSIVARGDETAAANKSTEANNGEPARIISHEEKFRVDNGKATQEAVTVEDDDDTQNNENDASAATDNTTDANTNDGPARIIGIEENVDDDEREKQEVVATAVIAEEVTHKVPKSASAEEVTHKVPKSATAEDRDDTKNNGPDPNSGLTPAYIRASTIVDASTTRQLYQLTKNIRPDSKGDMAEMIVENHRVIVLEEERRTEMRRREEEEEEEEDGEEGKEEEEEEGEKSESEWGDWGDVLRE